MLHGNIAETTWLLEKGANVDIQDNAGESAIFYAITNNDNNMVELLIKNNANVNILSKYWKKTPLIYAKKFDRPKIISILEAAIKEKKIQ